MYDLIVCQQRSLFKTFTPKHAEVAANEHCSVVLQNGCNFRKVPEEAAVWILNDHKNVMLQAKGPNLSSDAIQTVGLLNPVGLFGAQVRPAFWVF